METTADNGLRMEPISVLVADGHDVMRLGIRDLLESQPRYRICGEAANGAEAVAKAAELKPNIAILDVSMPELSGVEAARAIGKVSPDTEVLLLSVHRCAQIVREAVEAGARGYVTKSDSSQTLIAALQTLANHQPFFPDCTLELVLDGTIVLPHGGREARQPFHASLTCREREIFQRLAEGKRNKEIACELNISVKTADTHRSNVMRKLGMHSLSQLVRCAIRNHIIEP